MPGQFQEDILERRLAERHGVDLAGKRLDQIGDELVSALPLEAQAIVENLEKEMANWG